MSDRRMQLPDKEFFTTGEVAIHCAVTTDAVRKWVKAGKLRAEHTAGGHHRIHRNSILNFLKMKQEKRDFEWTRKSFQYCWEFHARSGGIYDSCRQCIVYRSRAGRCYELAKLPALAGHSMLFCTNTCDECEYFEIVHGKRPNLLVITDNEEMRATLTTQVIDYDCSLRFANRAYQCSLTLESYRPDYIILDCSQDGEYINGFVKDLSEDSRIPFVRIILLGEKDEFPSGCEQKVFAFMKREVSMKALDELIGGLKERTDGCPED